MYPLKINVETGEVSYVIPETNQLIELTDSCLLGIESETPSGKERQIICVDVSSEIYGLLSIVLPLADGLKLPVFTVYDTGHGCKTLAEYVFALAKDRNFAGSSFWWENACESEENVERLIKWVLYENVD